MPTPQGEPSWCVLIEETVGANDNKHWSLNDARPYPTEAEARARALEVAHTHWPAHPYSRPVRSIFQLDDNTWLVRIPGKIWEFSFRVSVGKYLGSFDPEGNPAELRP